MNSNFYFDFENKFRGSQQDVLEKLNTYDGLLNQILNHINAPKLLDIGSGRGEWIRKCSTLGFECTGIDFNQKMSDYSKNQDMNIIYDDALNTMRNFEDHTFDVISSFHMIEHLDQEYLSELIVQCKRILTTDGVLIMETPSIDNLIISTNLFYLDPTHITHINPSQLKFIVEHIGFDNAEIFYINGGPLQDSINSRLTRVFCGVAQDIVCIATSSRSASLFLNSQNSNWRDLLPIGITTLNAASDYDNQIVQREELMLSRLQAQEIAIYELRKQILSLEKNYEIIMVLLNTLKINFLVKIIKRIKKIVLKAFSKLLSLFNAIFKMIPSSLINIILSRNIILLFISILIYLLRKVKLYSFSSKIEKKYFQKVEVDQLSKKNNKFLLEFYHSNFHEIDENFYKRRS